MFESSDTTALLADVPVETPPLHGARRERLVRAGAALWRVTDPRGRVIGHLRAVTAPGGTRYRVERYQPATASLRDLGSFWNADEAVRTLRYLT